MRGLPSFFAPSLAPKPSTTEQIITLSKMLAQLKRAGNSDYSIFHSPAQASP